MINSERLQNEKALEKKSENIASLLAFLNSTPVWNMEYGQVKYICDTYFEDKEIIKIELRPIPGRVLVALKKDVKGSKDIIRKKK